ncbi:MAG: class I SAM-dependent methyltransferase [Chthonomonas sp.]|nr:class I SAM-dependent methyltransferase [Chthonomonas sp.]
MIAIATTREERIQALNFDYASVPKEAILPCNLCASDRWVVITHRDRYGYPARATTCADCGLTMLNPRMTPEAYGKFYEGVYRPLVSAYHGRLIDAKTIQAEQVPYARAFIEFAAPYITDSHRTLLDVGGSTGIVAREFMAEFGFSTTLIDPAPAETAEAAALGIESITGFVESWDSQGRKFDVVGLFQTIDHLMDLTLTLAKLREVISDHGIFLVDIVDFRAAMLRNRSVEEAIKIDHVYSLTEETAEALFARAGFAWVRKSYSADHLHVSYICVPTKPTIVTPESTWVANLLREIRQVQNTK